MDKTPDELELEAILNEFAPLDGPQPPQEEPPAPPAPEPAPDPDPEPEPAPEPEPEPEPEQKPKLRPKPRPQPTAPPEREPEPEEATKPLPTSSALRQDGNQKLPWWKRKAQPVHISEKVIQLPEADTSVTGRIGRLIEKGDRYAQEMFQGDAPEDPEATRREQLLPGVDWEEEPTHAPTPRRRRVNRHPRPDIPPGKLAARYKRGLGFLRARTFFAMLWCLPQLYLMLSGDFSLPLPQLLAGNWVLCCQVSAVCLAVSALLCADVLARGILCLVRLRLEGETLLLFAVAAAIADALTMPILQDRTGAMPYCAVVSVCLFFALWGRFLKRRGLWLSCRAAAGAAEPYLVTLDEKVWAGQDAFTKWSGAGTGYGSQLQDTDAVQRVYHLAAPLILLCAGLFSMLASIGRARPQLFFWCLSATLTAGCGFTSFLSYSMPFASLAQRLAKVGAALGGWDGVAWSGRRRGVLLTDTDLFPPGSVTLNGIKLIGDASMETSLSYTASLIRETGSGLERPFSDMLRAKSGLYRRVSRVVFHEGGVTGVIAGQSVYVGSGAFMELMGVALPQGLNVKTAVFCAVDGRLCAIFALSYTLHSAVAPAIDSLIANGLDPILATRDFLIIPDMLRQRFKLPVGRMQFPNLDRRRELSARRQEHERTLTAVLCREGLGPYAEAVVGSRRLLSAVTLGLTFDLLAAAAGLLLSFYLCLVQAFASLSAGALLAFLLLWLVPAALTAGWVNRY